MQHGKARHTLWKTRPVRGRPETPKRLTGRPELGVARTARPRERSQNDLNLKGAARGASGEPRTWPKAEPPSLPPHIYRNGDRAALLCLLDEGVHVDAQDDAAAALTLTLALALALALTL